MKDFWKEYSSEDDFSRYIKVWFNMFLKHPETYVKATLNNYYNYFYLFGALSERDLFGTSEYVMNVTNEECASVEMDLHYGDLDHNGKRYDYQRISEDITSLPMIRLLKITSVFIWLLLFECFFALYTKDRFRICISIPLVLCLCVALMGPCNGEYFRYIYGISVCIPVYLVLSQKGIKVY